MSKHWHYGFNMPGYMPDSEVFVTEDWELAFEALKFDIESDLEYLIVSEQVSDAYADEVEFDVDVVARFNMPLYYDFDPSKFVYWIEECDNKRCATEEMRLEAALEML